MMEQSEGVEGRAQRKDLAARCDEAGKGGAWPGGVVPGDIGGELAGLGADGHEAKHVGVAAGCARPGPQTLGDAPEVGVRSGEFRVESR
jgi:hypothetical protein